MEHRDVYDIEKDALPEVDWAYSMRRAMQQILPGLYLGPYGAASKTKLEELKKAGITHVVCVRCEQERNVVKVNFPDALKYLVVEMSDVESETLIPKVRQFNKFVDECFKSKGKLLVYCMDGMSRGPSLVIGYLMLKYGINFKEGLKFVQNRRFCVQPSPVFEVQLKEFEPICQALHIHPTASNGFKRSHDYSERESVDSFIPANHNFTQLRDRNSALGQEQVPDHEEEEEEDVGEDGEEFDVEPFNGEGDPDGDGTVGHHAMEVED